MTYQANLVKEVHYIFILMEVLVNSIFQMRILQTFILFSQAGLFIFMPNILK